MRVHSIHLHIDCLFSSPPLFVSSPNGTKFQFVSGRYVLPGGGEVKRRAPADAPPAYTKRSVLSEGQAIATPRVPRSRRARLVPQPSIQAHEADNEDAEQMLNPQEDKKEDDWQDVRFCA